MTISNEQQNLLDNLRAPIKSFRIFALEEVIRVGDSPEILSVLEEISVYEDDPECSMLISHAIAAVKERMEGSKKPEQIQIGDAASFLSMWHEADENMRMHILSNLPARLPKDIRPLGPDLLEGTSPVVGARVIRAFCRNWPEEKFVLISEKLYSDSLVLKLAALRTMVHMNPEQLLPDLPALLDSKDPEIKALAIRGLVKIDKEEALNHLQALLLSPNQSERLAGVQNCPLLPFEIVKPLLLKYFAAETNAELLTKAGWIIEMNPDVEVPFTLFEIAERSPAKKAGLVKKVLNEAVHLLEKSGILGDQFAAYTKKLQNWVNKRNALRYVKQIVGRLDTEIVSAEVDKSIIVALKQPTVAVAFKEALSWPVSELVKSRIVKYLGVKTVKSADSDNKPKEEQTSSKSNAMSQLEVLAALTPEKAAEKLDQLLLMLSHKNTDTGVKIAVFQCLTRCRLSGAEDIAVKNIKNPEVTLATASVEYLGIVDPDQIFPYLGQCLKVADVGMKSAALGILKNFDYNQAISSLRAMLYSHEPNQQKMALECMNQFDFALVRDMLTEYLCHDYPESILEAGLLHFAANPSADNVYSLYKIEQAHPGKIAEQAKQLREACPAPAEEMAVAPAEANATENNDEHAAAIQKANAEAEKQKQEEELKERLRIEKEKQKSKKPAYAYRSPSELPERNSKEQLAAIWEMTKNFVSSKALPISIAVFILVAGGFYILFVPKGNGATAAKGSAVVSEQSVIEGEVKRINNNMVIMLATNGDTILMTPVADGFKMPRVRDILRVSVVPYRQTKEGYKVVKIRGMRVIEEYSMDFGKEKAK